MTLNHRFCVSCGAPVAAGHDFCIGCGAPLVSQTVQGAASATRPARDLVVPDGGPTICANCGAPKSEGDGAQCVGCSTGSASGPPPPDDQQRQALRNEHHTVWRSPPILPTEEAASHPAPRQLTQSHVPPPSSLATTHALAPDKNDLPPPRSSATVPRAPVRVGVLLTTILVAMGVILGTWYVMRSDTTSVPASDQAANSKSESSDLNPTEPPPTAAPPPRDSSEPGGEGQVGASRPTFTARSALGLPPAKAADVLDERVVRDRPRVAELAGSWVPQVSSKCPGLDVDLGPNFTPDGVVDTFAVTEPEILALHVALAERYNAVTTTATELGVSMDSGPCAALTLWVSLVPQSFNNSEQALAWCIDQAIPTEECGARKIVTPGTTGTELMLREGA